MPDQPTPPTTLLADLATLGVIADTSSAPPMTPLRGGVSSEIWRVDLPTGPVVAKQALDQLRVAATWRAPLTRSRYEVAWMRVAASVCPGGTPAVIAAPADGLDDAADRAADGAAAHRPWTFVMAYLPPDRYRLWKRELLSGHVAVDLAAAVGQRLATIHAATAATTDLAASFDNLDHFAALRLDPYLDATAQAHPRLAGRLGALRDTYLANRIALVHGDVSPKNIFAGPDGPVFVDAECATWGDPAFDVSFCATHLLLKCLAVPRAAGELLASLEALTGAYASHIDWEPPAGFWPRCAALTGGLLLARVDGLSPVEYLDAAGQAVVRAAATELLDAPPATIAELAGRWAAALPTGTDR